MVVKCNKTLLCLFFILCLLKEKTSLEMDRNLKVGNHDNARTFFNNLYLPYDVSEISEPAKNRHRFYKISSVKNSKVNNENGIRSKIQIPKSKAPSNLERLSNDTKNKSNHFIISLIQSFANNKSQNETKVREFDNLKRILDDSRRKISPTKLMYEVPMIEKQEKYNNGESVIKKIGTVNSKANHISNYSLNTKPLKSRTVENLRSHTFGVDSNKLLSAEIKYPDAKVTKGRFLSIFEVVNFNNVDCFASNGLKGTCLHVLECSQASGIEMGSCADGFGICCLFQYSCGDQTSSNCLTFTNPGFPKPSENRISCTLTINKADPSISQLKLDFVQMELQPPTNGSCVDDQFIITGQNVNSIVPVLCGINNGQHMYVDVGDSPGPFYLSVLTASAERRLFQVGVCQTAASTPAGCLQRFTEPAGSIESFNYQTQGALQANSAPGYFNNLNYAICIDRASGTCSITYTNSDETGEYQYQILNYDSDGVPVIPPEQAGAEIFNCPDDFIVINGIRLCGERLNDASVNEDFTLNAPVTELSAGPIVFIFRTNGNVTGRGFKLYYKQNPCIAPR